ncbi:MAG: glutamyl-tRNA reductase [Propionibacteriaceae bacterium]|jgi:glutamyl-tRNA reductase|nr:glutamyl-tRNA reductase [Propionibacteriaceae bacterium]
MSIISLTASHHDVDLDTLERLSSGAGQLGRLIAARAPVRGVVVVATCNRYEVYIEAEGEAGPDTIEHVREHLAELVAQTSAVSQDLARSTFRPYVEAEASRHLFRVTAGLDSMVIGEREIAGQIKRSLAQARSAGTTSKGLEQLFQAAARIAKRVVSQTDVSATGRSLVDVGLDLAEPVWSAATGRTPGGAADWSQLQTLLIGTGAYAGATVAALRRRGVTQIEVYSASGRAATFAASHDVTPITASTAELGAVVARADVVVACSGSGSGCVVERAQVEPAVVATDRSGRPLVMIDLALRRDIDPAVADLPAVTLFDLDLLSEHVPQADRLAVEQARSLVESAVADFAGQQAARAADAAVSALVAAAEQRIIRETEVAVARFQAKLPSGEVADDSQRAAIERPIRRRIETELHDHIVALRAAMVTATMSEPSVASPLSPQGQTQSWGARLDQPSADAWSFEQA